MSHGSGIFCRIGNHHGLHNIRYECVQDLPLWEHPVHGIVLEESGESFIQPDVCPPGRCDMVTKPLMSILVGDDHSDALFVVERRNAFVIQDQVLAENRHRNRSMLQILLFLIIL